ncbi:MULTISPECIES: Tat pathway signal sequence domain protein [Streptomyces]|uniref:Tat pathway signal sequence domain protein n=1 Tax=Streptomyces TaxID=1883 RepID=UPI0023B8DFBE|nr:MULTISPECIES: Tat pathway signal sequence domain protein [unclassified Streptomyces]MDT0424168.1 Tat pathway signal sequence domain protein [Streptomyces sp. DSM 41859]WEH27196.1 Tat pathway signal sequence domain protein [Streptomyces sp. AM 3-1-1]
MSLNTIDRRSVLRAALGVAGAATAVSLAGAGPAAAHGRGRPARPPRRNAADLPVVPGMTGDRWHNEFWYQYDEVSYFNPTPEMTAAVGAIITPFGGFEKIYDAWEATRRSGSYPRPYLDLIKPNKDAFVVLSREQRKIYDEYYGGDPRGLVDAFQQFGQGTLYDPRRPEGERVHMMNFTPPDPTHAYHRWHPFLAGFVLLGIDTAWWTHINRLAGAAWELQSLAQPQIDRDDNPPLPRRTVDRLTVKWLRRDRAALDRTFDAWPYPADLGK